MSTRSGAAPAGAAGRAARCRSTNFVSTLAGRAGADGTVEVSRCGRSSRRRRASTTSQPTSRTSTGAPTPTTRLRSPLGGQGEQSIERRDLTGPTHEHGEFSMERRPRRSRVHRCHPGIGSAPSDPRSDTADPPDRRRLSPHADPLNGLARPFEQIRGGRTDEAGPAPAPTVMRVRTGPKACPDPIGRAAWRPCPRAGSTRRPTTSCDARGLTVRSQPVAHTRTFHRRRAFGERAQWFRCGRSCSSSTVMRCSSVTVAVDVVDEAVGRTTRAARSRAASATA